MKAAVTIEGKGYGEIEILPVAYNVPHVEARSIAYFCPQCGRIWAEIRREEGEFLAVHIPCRQHHKSLYQPGGSIWLEYYPHLTNAFTQEILEYETQRHWELFCLHFPEEAQASDLQLRSLPVSPSAA